MKMYINVILPLPLDGLFTYSVPSELAEAVQPFVRVKVPFGITKTHTALAVSVSTEVPSFLASEGAATIKPILAVLDAKPVLLPEQYRLWQWMSDYYMCPLGDILVAAFPHGIKKEETYRPRTETYIALSPRLNTTEEQLAAIDALARQPRQREVLTEYLRLSGWEEGSMQRELTKEELLNATHCSTAIVKSLIDKGFLQLYDKEVGRLNSSSAAHPENIKPLSKVQQAAYDDICRHLFDTSPAGSPSVSPLPQVLLHGVTSSGKTEIYIHIIQNAISQGKQVLYLLPEIALTVQITQRLQHVFGNRLGIYHSRYSDAERVEIWQKQLSDHPYDIILGARSAVFLPFRRLGLVIIDEEHESSFKQQEPSPRYHARSVAQMMAHWAEAGVLLGTATPSAESYHNALTGKYHLTTLLQRYQGIELPSIEVIDTKDLRHRKIMRGMFSPQLKEAVTTALQEGRQAILFLNRRGFSPVVECQQCGWSPKCPNCDVSLTYHKTQASLTCHYCGYTYRMPRECPDCHNRDLNDRGAGTEKVEEAIAETFPQARIARMDLDTTRTRNAYERIIAEFAANKTNLLIGTQMVTKGLDFSGVSVVGILSADSLLNQPDFRAFEHAFTMLTQVAGRAGRKGQRGRVILQTSRPTLPVIRQIVNNDYRGFYNSLMQERQEFCYPPFSRLIYIYLKHREDSLVDTAAIELANMLRNRFMAFNVTGTDNTVRVLGPDRPVVSRIKQLCIRKIIVKVPVTTGLAATRRQLHDTVAALRQDKRYKAIVIFFDVDPT